jgi:hypothetical protein
MAFADSSTYFDIGDGSIVGRFVEVDHGNTFEFSLEPERYLAPDLMKAGRNAIYPHRVWVADPNQRVAGEQGWRHALVKATVAYIVVDEDEFGQPVVQKWKIKNHTLYKG